MTIVPFSLKDAPALIEKLFPEQKLSCEAYKEQMAGSGKTLTALGNYWKGRKPLILNKAVILGTLLPAGNDLKRDLEIFETLMGMDERSLAKRMRLRGKEMPAAPYKTLIAKADRPETYGPTLHDHIWDEVNAHLGTSARSIPELTEQLGIMRFGRRPRFADTFSGSGQIPFEAARLGCDVYASDLNPIACMLTWGAFNIVGAPEEKRKEPAQQQKRLVERVRQEIDALGFESDGNGAKAKAFLYCTETTCPQSGWTVPLLPSLVISKLNCVVARLVPDPVNKRYEIEIIDNASEEQMKAAEKGTLSEGCLEHCVEGQLYRTKIATLRGDFVDSNGKNKNRLRQWEKGDLVFREKDIFRERLYCIQWQSIASENGKEKPTTEFRSITEADLLREQQVIEYVSSRLAEWQAAGILPDTLIERGDSTDEPIRQRGWTHWHHLFNPRQLLIAALSKKHAPPCLIHFVCQSIHSNSRLSRWNPTGDKIEGVFYNQALNTLWNYGTRGFSAAENLLASAPKSFPLPDVELQISNHPAEQIDCINDIYVTDPPYGDAVAYEEILEFFIAWLRNSPPPEFAHWRWDSRRSLAIKGEDDDFRRKMVAAYGRMREKMPDNGIQVMMFAHKRGAMWTDIANIIWESGLRVTAVWHVVTETESALRKGHNLNGTILIVMRKRLESDSADRYDFLEQVKKIMKENAKIS